ncbi:MULTISPECIES: endonuclease V [unclassified Meiothermus]|uniref:endonuclease V n=1 Tax=unclassified Meiothermus TaxID=370471 RepID=UPI000D7CC85B|nr:MULTISPECIES: endonuclease V [unclassified Meiothermus]PZA07106.1 endonuclease V [Meiothermus sp. Pnk-1]RYM40012.1 endonuclease V [Meiothermus sp. PNK-Is4]
MTLSPFPRPGDLAQATRIQKELRGRVVLAGDPVELRYLAALDASHPTRFSRRQGLSVAVAVLWDRQAQQVVEVAQALLDADTLFPYVPGFLSFREAPSYLAALAKLSRPPELLLVDGQGIAHPRGLGIAAHLGVYLDLPAIGVAKSLLYGKPQGQLPPEAGSAVLLLDPRGQPIGYAYRSRTGVKPLYVSPGHRVGLAESLEFVRSLPTRSRLPEPLRIAHIEAGKARRRGAEG